MTFATNLEHISTEVRAPLVEQRGWYAVYTCPRHEKRVADHLSRKSLESFLPTYRCVRLWKNGKAKIDLPLFPGYVFVRIHPSDQLRVLTSPSVVRILGSSSGPAEIADSEIQMLQAELFQLRAEPHPFLKIGQRVRIARGPFAGREGILARKKDELRVVLSLDLIQQSFSIELAASDLESY
jgi:transcription antitermination factor NusG